MIHGLTLAGRAIHVVCTTALPSLIIIKTPTGKYGSSIRVRVKALFRKIQIMFPWRPASSKPDIKELLLAPEALTPPREQHRYRMSPAFK